MKLSFITNLLSNYDSHQKSVSKRVTKLVKGENSNLTDLRELLKSVEHEKIDRELTSEEYYILWRIVIQARPILRVTKTQVPFTSSLYSFFGDIHVELSRQFQEIGPAVAPMWLDTVGLFSFENYQAMLQQRGNNLSVIDCLIHNKLITGNNPESQRNFTAAMQLTHAGVELLWTLSHAQPVSLLTQRHFDTVCKFDTKRPFDFYCSVTRLAEGGNLNQATLAHFIQNEPYVTAISRNRFVYNMQSLGLKIQLGDEPKASDRLDEGKLYLFTKNDHIYYSIQSRMTDRQTVDITTALGAEVPAVSQDIQQGKLRQHSWQAIFAATLQNNHRLFTGINPMVFDNLYLVFPIVVKRVCEQNFQNLAKKNYQALVDLIAKIKTEGASVLPFALPDYRQTVVDAIITEVKPTFAFMAKMDADAYEVMESLRDLCYTAIAELDIEQFELDKLAQAAKAASWNLPDLGIVSTFSSLFQRVAAAVPVSLSLSLPTAPTVQAEEEKSGLRK